MGGVIEGMQRAVVLRTKTVCTEISRREHPFFAGFQPRKAGNGEIAVGLPSKPE
jgi:ribosomal protein L31